AGELARDIRHYLAGDPIEAKRDSFVYFVRKRMRHYRPQLVIGTLFLMLIVGASITVATLLHRAALDRERAVAAEANGQYLDAFLKDILDMLKPGKAKGREVAVARLLADVDSQLAKHPPPQLETRALLHHQIGSVYRQIGRYQKAEDNLREALALRRQIYPAAHANLADSMHELATAYWWNGRYDDAQQLFQEALDMRRMLFGEEAPSAVTSLMFLAACRRSLGDYAGATALYEQVLEMRRKRFGDESMPVASARNNLAKCYLERGDYAAAKLLLDQVLATILKLHPDDDPDVANGLDTIAAFLMEQGKLAEARTRLEDAREMRRRFLGEEHPSFALSLYGLARLCRAEGDLTEADRLCKQGLDLQRQSLREGHPDMADSLCLLGRIGIASGALVDAEGNLREALAIRSAAMPAHWRTAEAEGLLVECLVRQGRLDDAERRLLQSHKVISEQCVPGGKSVREAVQRLVDLYQAWGKPDKAEDYRSLLSAAR
ncbi:MAG TPA: tetratricopeptide repeat protein, partial [Phycisphaerae bacterium]